MADTTDMNSKQIDYHNLQGIVGNYRIIRKIGRGGMGVVYLAEEVTSSSKLALKFPLIDINNEAEYRARFLREGSLAAKLEHNNICKVYGVEEINGQLVMAMEFIEGILLSQVIKSKQLMDQYVVAQLIQRIARGLQYAHERHVIHRDIKPQNIILRKRQSGSIVPVIMDFGLAKSLTEENNSYTKTGAVLGTPIYMPLEQWTQKTYELDHRVDIYALGIIFYQLLTGNLPFEFINDEPYTAWLGKLLTQEPTPIWEYNPGVNVNLQDVVMKSISRRKEDRHLNCQQLVDEIQHVLNQSKLTSNLIDDEFKDLPQSSMNLKPPVIGKKKKKKKTSDSKKLEQLTTEKSPLTSAYQTPEDRILKQLEAYGTAASHLFKIFWAGILILIFLLFFKALFLGR